MKSRQPDSNRIWFLFLFLAFLFAVFFLTPSLRPSSMLTVLNILILAPVVTWLERRGITRSLATLSLLAAGGVIVAVATFVFFKRITNDWDVLVSLAPQIQDRAMERVQAILEWARVTLGLEIQLKDFSFVKHGSEVLQQWLVQKAPALAGDFASALIFAPIFSFFLLRDSKTFEKKLIQLVPNAFFESFYTVMQRAGNALSQFLRAKIYEAALLGAMVTAGLLIIGAPHAILFGLIAGILNFIPYLGPILGAVPVVIFLGITEGGADKLVPSLIVILVANLIDMFYVFPVFVGRLVNLSVLTMLAAVAVGQELYGLIGMLLSVPLTACAKILFSEVYRTLYRQRI